jgi:hypothetical protein
MAPEPFLIDLRSASLHLSSGDVSTWGSGRSCFVSSLISDMPEERQAARAAIESIGANPVMFEDLGGQDITADDAYLAGVRRSDIYVGILGPRYGVRIRDGYSATEAEFREAERQGLRLCVFVTGVDGTEMDGAQRDLITGIRNGYTTSTFAGPDSLKNRIATRLHTMAEEDLAPWIRLGDLIFRAQNMRSDGQTIVVQAEVRDAGLHAELVRLRDQRASGIPYASPSEAVSVQLASLSSEVISTSTFAEQIVLTVQSANGSPSRMAFNNLTADEVDRRALSDGLFGTQTLSTNAWGTMQAADPLARIRGLELDDVIVRPVTRLLINEHLLRNGIAPNIEAFSLGPEHGGGRRLRLAWRPQQRYSNQPRPGLIEIDGVVTL